MAISAAAASAIPAAIGTTGGLLGSIISGNQAKKNRQMQYKMFQEANQFNADQATLAYQRTMSEWDRQFNAQNAYNDPSAQFQRSLNAGLNPYASLGIFGNASSVSANSSPSASSVTPPSGNLFPNNAVSDFLSSASSTISTAMQIMQATKQGATLGNDIDYTNGDILSKLENLGVRTKAEHDAFVSQSAESAYKTAYNTLMVANVPQQVAEQMSLIHANTIQAYENIELAQLSGEEKRWRIRQISETFADFMRECKANAHLSESKWKQVEQAMDIADMTNKLNIKYTDQQIRESQKRIENMMADIRIRKFLAGEQSKLWRSQRGLFDSQAYNYDMNSSFVIPADVRNKDAQSRKLHSERKSLDNNPYNRALRKSDERFLDHPWDFISGNGYLFLHDLFDSVGSGLSGIISAVK